jgi:Mg2+ and Co2+ transporter CorA
VADEEKTTRDKGNARGDALGDIANLLAENPVLHQVLNAALGARDIANSATGTALSSLNVATASDLERFARRLRSVSDRLESVEDRLDQLADEIASIHTSGVREDPPPPPPTPASIDQERLGLSE